MFFYVWILCGILTSVTFIIVAQKHEFGKMDNTVDVWGLITI